MNDFLKAMDFRHACKIFDENKKIPESQFLDILESGRMSPSSMGMEPTRILVIRDENLKKRLREACWNQVQITSCAELVVLKSLISPLIVPSNYVDSMSLRRGKTQEQRDSWKKLYKDFLEKKEAKGESIANWSAKQAYIMASSMMNCAAFMGIDSCAIEGFETDLVHKILEIDTFKEFVSLILPFGYRIKEQQRRYRLPLSELVEYK
ncbi:NAD(P)H-dependent oxidoreductase [Helicobacter sp. 16-1353]|uniref:NAD(P)H-dependent oxidoreductase n=1 Tax=Helicobacter sp. 16-1353 TaxID=2004996 RepID=UPI000DCBFD6E|nr:NAD(P)H-dependent oxidoreductase [Helicobacter sp. 16-1353]RAX55141.1 NAD(P)H-dependent oxidoreductase [Helicobacter sp. 16-1353]